MILKRPVKNNKSSGTFSLTGTWYGIENFEEEIIPEILLKARSLEFTDEASVSISEQEDESKVVVFNLIIDLIPLEEFDTDQAAKMVSSIEVEGVSFLENTATIQTDHIGELHMTGGGIMPNANEVGIGRLHMYGKDTKNGKDLEERQSRIQSGDVDLDDEFDFDSLPEDLRKQLSFQVGGRTFNL